MSAELLIVGASGVVGRTVLRHFEAKTAWGLTGLSRRKPDFASRCRFLSADLADPAACEAIAEQLSHVTHVLYCANSEPDHLLSGWLRMDHVEANVTMLRNLFDPMRRRARDLRRVILMQGTKAYGAAAGTFKIPAKEDDPRSLAPNFYYGQEDYIRAAQAGTDWSWVALRPQFVCGFALGSPMNGLSGVAAYAAISRELGLPLRFPGSAPRIHEATDARLLAQAIEWVATAPQCANETFNIVNGDCYTWDSLWPKIARLFGMEWAPPAPARLARIMVGKDDVWRRIVTRHDLRPYTLAELVPNWSMTDYVLGYKVPEQPMLVSGLKARRFGFDACMDSEEMYLEWLRILQDERIIPT
jgi:nucleoside-diphosphate-sugar epimerase